MKFANLMIDDNVKMLNIGDTIQILAIENLYTYMGIDSNDLIRIKITELNTYNGEHVILPINYPFFGYYDLSKKIIPVYLGISLMSPTAANGLKLRQFEPIGCRDIHTFNELISADIDAYYAGCLTLAFPRNTSKTTNKKVFIIDVPSAVVNKIPKRIMQTAEFGTQIFYDNDCMEEHGVREIYQRYFDEASLVITSRIHCAMPCIAAGIPVVFICDALSFRYTVLQNLIPIYTEDDVENIDWNPQPLDLENQKKDMLEYAKQRVESTYNKYVLRYKVSSYFENDSLLDYKIDTVWVIMKYINENWDKNASVEYMLWGVTQIAEIVYQKITTEYPKAILSGVLDMYKSVIFHDTATVNIDALKDYQGYVFVTVGAANTVAEKIFNQYQITKHVICYNGLYIVDGKRIPLHGLENKKG